MSRLISDAICEFCCVSLDRLRIGSGSFHDGLREFRKLVLDVAEGCAIFGGHLLPLLVMAFLEYLVHCSDGHVYGLAGVRLLVLPNYVLRQDVTDFLHRLDDFLWG